MAEKQQSHSFFWIVSRFIPLMGVVFFISFFSASTAIGATLYKDYVVRQDRGVDILCEPYTVQPGDWVFKIFQQKGEIANTDFRDFLSMFHRLNPQVPNANMIRPGQVIDIPLKQIKKGHLPGQDSGVVTIPFVMVDEAAEKARQHAQGYTIQQGDTVSRLITTHFGGRFGDTTYRQGLSLFKALNPHLKDVNQIRAGASVVLPDPSIREQMGYDSLFDAKGNLVGQFASAAQPAAHPSRPTEKLTPMAEAALMVGGRLLDKGTHYLPTEQGTTFELDLSKYPVIDIMPSPQVIVSASDDIMGADINTVRSWWSNLNTVKVARISKNASAVEIAREVLALLEPGAGEKTAAAAPVTISDNGVQIQVTAKWIHALPSDDDAPPRHVCITPVEATAQATDPGIVQYLARHAVDIRDILPGTSPKSGAPLYPALLNPAVMTREMIDSSDPKAMIETFTRMMGFHYSPNVGITFPYTGIQVQALSNLVSFGNGNETLVDFGDLYGDAVAAIRNTGLSIVQILPDSKAIPALSQLLDMSGMAHTPNPVFYAAERSAEFNTAIQIHGVLVTRPESQLLFTDVNLPEAVSVLIQRQGTRIVYVGHPQ
ncbi:LysM peptidoglycan-binding domain-containing protein [Desulfosarcina sp. OttesenSCG-928-B08]|nr:LysM peptidoglycan-binding domain-containing protein [Desulfosarcina sp. OttesenSCG-928-B08]